MINMACIKIGTLELKGCMTKKLEGLSDNFEKVLTVFC